MCACLCDTPKLKITWQRLGDEELRLGLDGNVWELPTLDTHPFAVAAVYLAIAVVEAAPFLIGCK